MPVNPPVLGAEVREWARETNLFLRRNLGRLFFKVDTDNPSENGIFLWDDDGGYPVVSDQDAFKEIVVRQSAPSANTGATGDKAGLIAWDTSYIYVCTGDYDGTTAIWKRVALATW